MGPIRKFARLKKIISDMGSVLVAFSGGLDSSFLLKAALSALPRDKVLAVTADSPTYPAQELAEARSFAAAIGARHKVIKTGELKDKRFLTNPRRRCYHCKKELFARLKKAARLYKLAYICDASNVSDKTDFRPGKKALGEMGIRSPLEEAGFDKADIRISSRRLGLKTWDKPASACLASRIPYGARITPALLKRIERAESLLHKMGFAQARLRHHGPVARIEVNRGQIQRLMIKRRSIIDKIKSLGYNYVTVDLEGYRTGSMNES